MKIKKKTKEKLFFLVLALFIFAAYQIITTYSKKSEEEQINYKIPDGELSIKYIDVGQADSILISTSGHNVLIDAGNEEDGPKIVNYLKNIGIKEFDFVIGTHPHEDHIGGLDDVINNFKVEKIYLPKATTTTKTFTDLLDAIENNNLKITIPTEGEKVNIGEASFEFIYSGESSDDLNATSIINKLVYGKYSFLFTGDTTSDVEKQIIDKNIDIDFLKVAHHGSQYSTTANFLKKATPKVAIISVGKDNSYKHPSDKTINRIKKYTNEIYRTDEKGTITITIDKDDYKIDFEKTDTDGGKK